MQPKNKYWIKPNIWKLKKGGLVVNFLINNF